MWRCSSKDFKFGHFMSLFYRGRQKNASKGKMHVRGVGSVQKQLFLLINYASLASSLVSGQRGDRSKIDCLTIACLVAFE